MKGERQTAGETADDENRKLLWKRGSGDKKQARILSAVQDLDKMHWHFLTLFKSSMCMKAFSRMVTFKIG